MLKSLITSLALTVILELSLARLLGLRDPRDFLLILLVNVVTNPLVGLIFDLWFFQQHSLPPWYLIAPVELTVVLVEGLLYRGRLHFEQWNPFVLSLMLNLISYTGGIVATCL